ncbi:MAG TPA: choice-of-anchor tandem repeat GloVer-containing protein [Terriglobales bacterium]
MSARSLFLAAWVFLSVSAAWGASYKVLHTFAGGADGAYPNSPLVLDAQGNLYGVTNSGGNNGCDSSLSVGCGVIFALTPDGKGGWKEAILHVFDESAEGGNAGAGVVADSSGNLYGTTQYYGPFDNGVLWQMQGEPGGKWKERILHPFHGTSDGFGCFGLSFNLRGRLFGTTYAGGKHDDGIVFELIESQGKWRDVPIYDFAGGSKDGSSPSDALTFGPNGEIYGTTYEGGPHLTGTVFKMEHTASGWQEMPIYIFGGLPFGKSSDGTNPVAGVVMDEFGNLYGTADYGGASGVGTVYKLSSNGKGGWTEHILHVFSDGKDGGHPSGLIRDAAGNLYGTTSGHNTNGSVYKMSPGADGKWTFTVLHDFTGGDDGGDPSGQLVMDSAGNLYGATNLGGKDGLGVVFEIEP